MKADEDDFDCDDCGELTEEVYTGKDGGFYCEDCINKIGSGIPAATSA